MTEALALLGDTLPYTLEGALGLQAHFNAQYRPLQILVCLLLLGIALIGSYPRKIWRQLQSLILTACWLASGLIYQLSFAAMLDWTARYTAWLLVAQGALILLSELPGNDNPARHTPTSPAGMLLMLTALLLLPILQWAGNTPVESITTAGFYPALTAMFTAGWLLSHDARWWLWPVPLAWMAMALAIGLGLGYIPAMLPLPITLLVLIAHRYRRVRRRRVGA